MGLDLIKLGNIMLIKLCGEFDLGAADYCRQEIDEKVRTEGAKDILFDLEKVTFIDSSGLGVILGRYRKAKENRGKVAISNANPRITKILELSGIMRLIPVYPTTSQALRFLGRGVG
ncbi:MAG: anti-sigma factor antagonist [Syntrophaceticus schinkii]|nr:anti-sigma factor antagonist [Syntrophaceticus schinkii]MDD4260993.1 anti-sigma factor antagonist [Syntrophaceticus schinkii]